MANPPIEAFLLSAGLGKRMGPLSRVLPKPAWTLNGKPLLQWGADGLRQAGFQSLACNAHWLSEKLRAVAGTIEVFEEPQLLGSAGGLRHVLDRVGQCLLVWNADALAEIPWELLQKRHLKARADLSWLLIPHPGGPWTSIWLDEQDRIILNHATGKGPYLFTGAACWSPRAMEQIPHGPSELRDLLPHLDRHLGVVTEPFLWREIGTPEQLIAAAGEWAPKTEGRVTGCYIHPSAIPGGDLRGCVLGPGAAPPPTIRDENALWYEENGHQVRLKI